MHFFLIFVLGDKVGLLIPSQLMHIVLHAFLEVIQCLMALLLVEAVGEVKTFHHLMRMIPVERELLVVV